MSLRKADGPLTVHRPSAEADHPSWTRVGAIAAIGFVVGVAWPRLAGVRMGPSVPGPISPVASAVVEPNVASVARVAPSAPVAAALVAPVPAASAPAIAAPSSVHVTPGHGALFACKSASGDTLKAAECGTLTGLDEVVLPRLRKLSECPEASGARGKLRLVLHPDFSRGAVGAELGRTPGVSSPEPLLACARSALTGVSLAGIAHENPRYSVSYVVTFAGEGGTHAPEDTPPAPTHSSTPSTTSPDGTAQVEWEVAIVRDEPKTGKVVARLQRGTEIHIGPAKDGWYPVKYGDAFASDGWVYRGAIGR
jgi:hypothetical protein